MKSLFPVHPFTRYSISCLPSQSEGSDNLLSKQLFPLRGDLSIWGIGESSDRTGIRAKRFSTAEITGHGFIGHGVDHGRTIGAGIDARFAADTPMGICDNSLCFRDTFPGPGRTDGDAGGFYAMLAHDRHINSNFSPFVYLNPGEGRAGSPFMGQAANHFAGLATGTEIR
jgi:hypothetical protein